LAGFSVVGQVVSFPFDDFISVVKWAMFFIGRYGFVTDHGAKSKTNSKRE
jgi:hypothetical protein